MLGAGLSFRLGDETERYYSKNIYTPGIYVSLSLAPQR